MILVTGDVMLDHNVYEGQRRTPDAPAGRGSRYLALPGGATLTYGLLNALDSGCTRLGLECTSADRLQSWPGQFQAHLVWRAIATGKNLEDGQHWALAQHLGYGEPSDCKYPGEPSHNLNTSVPQIIVIDDGNLGFRQSGSASCWPACLSVAERPAGLEWIILKMARPLGSGDLDQPEFLYHDE